jgi:MFS family permease
MIQRKFGVLLNPFALSNSFTRLKPCANFIDRNPQNWPAAKKGWALTQLCFYSMAVYGASSMYVPGEEGVMQRFHVGATPAAVGLAIYVVGYGVGPLLFAPLSEIASIGRNWVYVPTFFLFVILSIPTAFVENYAGLLVLRFLTGFFGSPCLANGGASVGDMASIVHSLTSTQLLTIFSILSLSYRSIYQPGQQLASGVQQLVLSLRALPFRRKAGDGDCTKSSGLQARS